ncbi:pleckstrin homology domain-containing family F member 1-like [Genypterus blacodes]|uniref:pleckstrin homology domain-containing family F member 1-like n=1 Tax=Genypterus blacodes TaxID=154954 RepID=UPI003F76C454
MVDQSTFSRENRERIQAVENSFGPSGRSLYHPGRFLIGEGRLRKQNRRRPQPKIFYLFNDVMVYGSIILNGRWHKKQKIIPLEDIQLEDLEDSARMKNQWLIRTPRKSFYVAAASYEEKQDWIKHIEDCRTRWLQGGVCRPSSDFAVTWIPDKASAICMRCCSKFTATQRRHHCRNCGYLVCASCSKQRTVIGHIHPTKQVRVCSKCHTTKEAEAKEIPRWRGDSTESMCTDENDVVAPTDVEDKEESMEDQSPSRWLDSRTLTYVYLKPEHRRP